MLNESELGFKIPERCETFSFRLHPSTMKDVDELLDGASRGMLVETLLKRWVLSIKARRAERARREQQQAQA